jgi:ribosomal protein S18 acetylase RimI-like enzyme
VIALRAYEPGDLEALAALWPGGREALEEHFDTTGLVPTRDVRIATFDGRPIAARDVRVMARGDEDPLILESGGPTSEPAWATDAPAALFGWMLEHAADLMELRDRRRATLQTRAAPDDRRTRELFERFGMHEARLLWSMEHPAPGRVEPVELPAALVIRGYAPGQHDAEWVAAFNDAFADHWGGWMQMAPELWRRYLVRTTFRPELSLVAWDGGEIAGFCHCRLDGDTGMVRYVGVQPRWRRRGLGEALTREGLRTLAAAGAERVTLGVDGSNTTGAHLLYERLGFVKTREHVMYRRELTR